MYSFNATAVSFHSEHRQLVGNNLFVIRTTPSSPATVVPAVASEIQGQMSQLSESAWQTNVHANCQAGKLRATSVVSVLLSSADRRKLVSSMVVVVVGNFVFLRHIEKGKLR